MVGILCERAVVNQFDLRTPYPTENPSVFGPSLSKLEVFNTKNQLLADYLPEATLVDGEFPCPAWGSLSIMRSCECAGGRESFTGLRSC